MKFLMEIRLVNWNNLKWNFILRCICNRLKWYIFVVLGKKMNCYEYCLNKRRNIGIKNLESIIK